MENINCQDLRARMEKGEKINLVDVREPAEHEDFNIGGSLIPLGSIALFDIGDLEAMKNQEIICYCRSGKRSMQACLILESQGFTNVKNLSGGMLAWAEMP